MGRGGGAAHRDAGGGGGGARGGAGPREGMRAAVGPPAFGRFFLPGPTDVHPAVLAAMQRPMIGHRSKAMEQLLAGIEPQLGRLFRTARPVLVGTASATGLLALPSATGCAGGP